MEQDKLEALLSYIAILEEFNSEMYKGDLAKGYRIALSHVKSKIGEMKG